MIEQPKTHHEPNLTADTIPDFEQEIQGTDQWPRFHPMQNSMAVIISDCDKKYNASFLADLDGPIKIRQSKINHKGII